MQTKHVKGKKLQTINLKFGKLEAKIKIILHKE